MKNNNNLLGVLMVTTLIVTIIGGTIAYWTWQSTNAEKTNVTFTVASGFTCGADAGGDITSSQKMLAPAACTNTTYAIQRTVTVSTTQDAGKTIVLDMWLKVNSIGTYLAQSSNFKYALTNSALGCDDESAGTDIDVIAEGTFNGKTAGSQVMLLDGKQYAQSTPQAGDVYYLYIWLDAAEENPNTMNQAFNFTVEGSCTDELPEEANINENEVYVVSNEVMTIGSPIPGTVTTHIGTTGPSDAMADWATFTGVENDTRSVYLKQVLDGSGNIAESYVCFVRNNTPYCLKGNDEDAYLDNAKRIYDAFGSDASLCDGYNPYENFDASSFYCDVSDLNAYADSDGSVYAYVDGARCDVSGLFEIADGNSNSNCHFLGGVVDPVPLVPAP